ncbi:MAG: carbohydrate-binding domain-containing protein [Clostridia bacterium]|nr:carbohydrate-binding domain-containing protein [Clostridia bacterium]
MKTRLFIVTVLLHLFLFQAALCGLAEQTEALFSLKDLSIQDLTDAYPIHLNGESVTISEPGIYALSGTIENGSVTVNADDTGTVYLLLNNVSVSNDNGSAISIRSAEKVILTMIEGTKNTFTQNAFASDENLPVIDSTSDLTINGNGILIVNGTGGDGIRSQNRLRIVSGNIAVAACKDALSGNTAVCIGSGSITATSESGDCIKAGDSMQKDTGSIFISGGVLQLSTGGGTGLMPFSTDPLPAVSLLHLPDAGETELSGSLKGLNAAYIQITAGCLTIDTVNDAIHSSGDANILGGILTVLTHDSAIHAGKTLTVSDGTIDILQSFRGLSAADLKLNGGIIHITASSDGISSKGIKPDQLLSPAGDTQGKHSAASDTLSLAGTDLYVLSGGDGINVQNLTMSSGEVYIESLQSDMNAALDYEGSFVLTGGTLIALGSSETAQGVSRTSIPGTMLTVKSGSLSISTAEGTQLLSFETAGHFDSAVIYSEQFMQNTAYLITTGSLTQSAVMTLDPTDP